MAMLCQRIITPYELSYVVEKKCVFLIIIFVTLYEYFLVFPEGEIQEVPHPVRVSSFVDMNGNPVSLPLPTNRMIVYQVSRMKTVENEPGFVRTYYLLEQLNALEPADYVE